MAKEYFHYSETAPLFKLLETLRQRSGVSRGQAFEDWLTAIVCALAAETKEEDYLQMVERHKKGKPGKRGIDLMGNMFGELVNAMTNSDADILGDLFEGAITYGENGLYLTPQPISELMANMTVSSEDSEPQHSPTLINDCCCGTGRMLLEAAKLNPEAELVGQDVDPRCVRITAINLGLRGKYGWVVCGNTLTGDTLFAYRIGHFYHEGPNGLRRGVIREVPPEQSPVPVIASRMKQDAKSMFEQEVATEPSVATPNPGIIEIPAWLARLEPGLAQQSREETDSPYTETNPSARQPDPSPRTQKKLF